MLMRRRRDIVLAPRARDRGVDGRRCDFGGLGRCGLLLGHLGPLGQDLVPLTDGPGRASADPPCRRSTRPTLRAGRSAPAATVAPAVAALAPGSGGLGPVSRR